MCRCMCRVSLFPDESDNCAVSVTASLLFMSTLKPGLKVYTTITQSQKQLCIVLDTVHAICFVYYNGNLLNYSQHA